MVEKTSGDHERDLLNTITVDFTAVLFLIQRPRILLDDLIRTISHCLPQSVPEKKQTVPTVAQRGSYSKMLFCLLNSDFFFKFCVNTINCSSKELLDRGKAEVHSWWAGRHEETNPYSLQQQGPVRNFNVTSLSPFSCPFSIGRPWLNTVLACLPGRFAQNSSDFLPLYGKYHSERWKVDN